MLTHQLSAALLSGWVVFINEMFHPALLLLACGQGPATPATQAPKAPEQLPAVTSQKPPTTTAPAQTPQAAQTAPQPFVKPITVAEPIRLAITPKIDGKIDAEEWDPLTTVEGTDTFFQWEPDRVHFAAAHVPNGQDLIISIDAEGNGWLVGKDNLEIRVHWNNGNPEVTERLLDNTPVSGPTWIDGSNFKASTTMAGTNDDKGHTVELTVQDPGLGIFADRVGRTVGLRTDIVPETSAPADPLLPRVVTPVRMTMARGSGIPAGLTWKPEIDHPTVVPGDPTKIRFTFTGNDDLGIKRVEMRSEGLARDYTDGITQPFPRFDKKSRAIVDYKTKVSKDAPMGYRVVRASFDQGGKPVVMQASYEVSPVVSFSFPDKEIASSTEPQTVKVKVLIHSNTHNRVDGVFRVIAPDGWKVPTGSEKYFLIYEPRASKHQVFSLVVPGGFKGTAPLKLVADFAGYHAEQLAYLVVNSNETAATTTTTPASGGTK